MVEVTPSVIPPSNQHGTEISGSCRYISPIRENAKRSALDPENVENLVSLITFHSYLFHTKGLTTEHILYIYIVHIVHIVIVYICKNSLLKAVNW